MISSLEVLFDINCLMVSESRLLRLAIFKVPLSRYPPGGVKTLKMEVLELVQECHP